MTKEVRYLSSPSVTDRDPRQRMCECLPYITQALKAELRAERCLIDPQPLAPLWGGEKCGQPEAVSSTFGQQFQAFHSAACTSYCHLTMGLNMTQPIHCQAQSPRLA